MTAKEYLSQACRLNEMVNSYLAEIDNLRALASSISGSNFQERVDRTRNTDPPFARCICKIIDMEKELSKGVDKLISLKGEINDAINQVANPDEKMLLRYRYINNYSWNKICILMSVSCRTVHRIHSSALQKFIVPN
jgi:DNA-directed RNA polymerase specialized sigma subunit